MYCGCTPYVALTFSRSGRYCSISFCPCATRWSVTVRARYWAKVSLTSGWLFSRSRTFGMGCRLANAASSVGWDTPAAAASRRMPASQESKDAWLIVAGGGVAGGGGGDGGAGGSFGGPPASGRGEETHRAERQGEGE